MFKLVAGTRKGNGQSVEVLLALTDRELVAALRTRLRQTCAEMSAAWGLLKGLRSHVSRSLRADISQVPTTALPEALASGAQGRLCGQRIKEAVAVLVRAGGVPRTAKDLTSELTDLYQLVAPPQPLIESQDGVVPDLAEEVRGRLDAERLAADLQEGMGQYLLPLVLRHQGRTLSEVAEAQGGIAISTAHSRVEEGQKKLRRYARRRQVGPNSLSRALDLLSGEGTVMGTPHRS